MFKSDLSAKGLISVALLLGPVTGFSAESYQKVGDDLSGELVSIGSDTLLGMMNK